MVAFVEFNKQEPKISEVPGGDIPKQPGISKNTVKPYYAKAHLIDEPSRPLCWFFSIAVDRSTDQSK
jgi:hypothetical protein